MENPVLLLAFANDRDAYLETLKLESSNISKALEPLEDKSLLKVHREESADTGTILHAINRFDGQMKKFLRCWSGRCPGRPVLLSTAPRMGRIMKLMNISIRYWEQWPISMKN